MTRLPGFAMPGEILSAARWYATLASAGDTAAAARAEDLLAIAEELATVDELVSLDACRN